MNPGHIKSSLATKLLYLSAIVGGYMVFFYINSQAFGNNITTCPFRNITGVPCPGCGMGRATLEFVHLEIQKSFLLHPLAIPFNIAIIISSTWLMRDIFTGKDSFIKFIKIKPNIRVLLAICFVLLAVWGRNILVGV